MWIRLSYQNKSPCSCLTATFLFTRIWDCSEDTELINRNDCAKNSFNSFSIGTAVYRSFFTSFAFERSSRQRTRDSENWVSVFSKFDHHQFSDFVPFSSRSCIISRIPLCLWSKSEEWPTSCWKSFGEQRHKCGISNTFRFIVFFSPYDVIEHRHEDNSSLELFGFAHIAHELLDFADKLQCWESWEHIPTRIPSVLRRLCPVFCIVMNLWIIPTVVPKQYLILGSDSSFQDTTQNLRMRKPLQARDWWLLHHWPEITVSIENFPTRFETLQKFHPLVPISTVQKSRRFAFKVRFSPSVFDGM